MLKKVEVDHIQQVVPIAECIADMDLSVRRSSSTATLKFLHQQALRHREGVKNARGGIDTQPPVRALRWRFEQASK